MFHKEKKKKNTEKVEYNKDNQVFSKHQICKIDIENLSVGIFDRSQELEDGAYDMGDRIGLALHNLWTAVHLSNYFYVIRLKPLL